MAKAVDFEVLICGAGPVGLSIAALLLQRGLPASDIAVLDAKTLAHSAADPRSIALSHGSQQILQQIKAWPHSANPIRQIHVSRRGHFGRTLIDSADYSLPALGYVTRYGALVTALASSLAQQALTVLRPTRVTALNEEALAVTVQTACGQALRARIVVQAEGNLQTRPAARVYDQTAIVAHVRASAPLPSRAFERFTAEGPLALLPQEDGYALVWCVRPAHATQLLALTDSDFLQALGDAFGQRLGQFIAVGARSSYPLALHADNTQPSTRIVSIGNAAQSLHPVAGQGLNLGLRDATTLARLLARDNAVASVQQFDAQRRADRRRTVGLTDLMARAFASAADGALSQTVLGATLGIVDGIAPLKRLLAEQMMFGRR